MNFKYRKKVKQTLAAVLAAMLLTGCAKGASHGLRGK